MSNKISLVWSGATDDIQIKGYRIKYFLGDSTIPNSVDNSTDPTLVNGLVPHVIGATFSLNATTVITNSSVFGGATYSFTISSYQKHTFYIETVDSSNQSSTDYIIEVDVSPTSLLSLSSSPNNSCPLNLLTSVPVYLTPLDSNQVPTINSTVVYTDNSHTTPYNGVIGGTSSWWTLLNNNIFYSIRIDNSGLIVDIAICDANNILHKGKVSQNSYSSVNTTGVTYGAICTQVVKNDIYYLGPITSFATNNTVIYTGYNTSTNLLTGKKVGLGKYYLLNSDEGSFIVKILGSSITDPNCGKLDSVVSYALACPVSSTCCFVAGTKVTMFDLTQKNIEDILIGDFILTYNEENQKQEKGEVKNLISPLKDNIVQYQLEDDTIIESTTCHPYWVVGKGWSSFDPNKTKELYSFDVDQINENDLLLSINNVELSIKKITILDIITITYNLEIEGNHTYYANNILVHNKTVIPNEPVKYLSDGNTINPQWQTWYDTYHTIQNCSIGIGN